MYKITILQDNVNLNFWLIVVPATFRLYYYIILVEMYW